MEKARAVSLHTLSQPSPSKFRVGRNSDPSGWGLGLQGLLPPAATSLLSLCDLAAQIQFTVFTQCEKDGGPGFSSLLWPWLSYSICWDHSLPSSGPIIDWMSKWPHIFRSRVGGSVVLISSHLFSKDVWCWKPASSLFLLPGDLAAYPLLAQLYWNRFLLAPLPFLSSLP